MSEEKNVPKLRFPGFTEPWEQRKLGEVFEQTANFVNPNEKEIELWSLTVEDGLTSKTERYNREFLVKKDNNFKEVRPGEIVYNPMNMTLGAVGYNGMAKSVAVSGYYTTMITKKGHDSYYINTWLKSPQAISLYKTFATGSLIEKQRVQFSTLSIIPATFPEYEEQAKIGQYFSNLDHLITLHQRKLGHVKDLKKSMLQKMFPKNGELYPEVRFPGFTAAWEQRKLGEVATFINGRAYSQDELLDEGKYKVLRVGNFYTNDSWYYSDLELPDKFYAQEGDLLYTWSATFGPHIWHGNKVIYHYHIWKVELSDKLDKTFTLQLLEEDKANILANKNGSTMVHITKEGMEQKQISIPSSVQEQAQIGAYFEQLDNLITLHQRELDHLQLLKKGMLQQMFV